MSECLEVRILKTLAMGTPDQQTPNKLGEIDTSLPAEDKTPPGRSLGNLKRRRVDLSDDCGDDEKDNASGNGKVMKSYNIIILNIIKIKVEYTTEVTMTGLLMLNRILRRLSVGVRSDSLFQFRFH